VYNGTVHQLVIDFEKAYDSDRCEVLYNVFSGAFRIQNGLEQGDFLVPFHFTFALEYAVRKM
jgi:hypothetical protein